MKHLQLSKDVALPVDVITERLAFVGQSGSGKTYAAMRLGELMLEAGAQIIALDPMAVWWGLLSAADGQASGYPVHVFGGEHAHVPIVPGAGHLVAEVIVGQRISAVIDIADFTRSDQVMFSSAFAERFYEMQVRAKQPVHVFFEEAHQFLPQNLPAEGRGGDPRKNPAVMLNRMERIVRMGRSQGIGCSMITQQPQAVNKAALNQAGTLLAMRTMGKHERKAIGDWMADKATDDAQLKLDQLLPKLGTGEAWVASPHFLGLFKHTRISKKTTFDSSATPKFGAELEPPKVLAAVDVEALRAAMATVVEEVEKDDPAPLRRRIAELERQLAAKPVAKPEVVEVSVFDEKQRAALIEVEHQVLELNRTLRELQAAVEARSKVVPRTFAEKLSAHRKPVNGAGPGYAVPIPNEIETGSAAAPVMKLNRAGPDGLSPKALDLVRELVAFHPKALSRKELAARVVLRCNRNFRNYLSEVRAAGLMADSDSGDLVATDAALKLMGTAEPKRLAELVTRWNGQLSGKAQRILAHALDAGACSRAELAAAADLQVNRNFRNYLSELRSAALLEAGPAGRLVPGHALFLADP